MQWINGKKTYIATGLLFSAAFIRQVVIGEFHADPEWLAPTASALDWIGMAVGGVGVTHKMVKSKLGNTASRPNP